MSNRNQLSVLIALLAISVCQNTWAQVAAETPMALVYDAISREVPATAYKETCPIFITPTEDARQNKLTIGEKFGAPLLTGDASPWVTNAFLQLKDYGYATTRMEGSASTTDAPPSNGLLVKTTVTRAYTWVVGLKIFSMVALKAQFFDKNGLLQEKYYRAHGDKTNMWGASSEYVTTLNYGVNNLLHAVAEDLTQLCKGVKVEGYSYAGPATTAAKK
jgi:hypothetical protein